MEHEYEPEIDIKNFLFYILYKWRTILFAGTFFACCLVGIKQ